MLNSHFTAIVPRLPSEIPSDHIDHKPEDFLTKCSERFQVKKINPSKVLKLLKSVKIVKATVAAWQGDHYHIVFRGEFESMSGNLLRPG